MTTFILAGHCININGHKIRYQPFTRRRRRRNDEISTSFLQSQTQLLLARKDYNSNALWLPLKAVAPSNWMEATLHWRHRLGWKHVTFIHVYRQLDMLLVSFLVKCTVQSDELDPDDFFLEQNSVRDFWGKKLGNLSVWWGGGGAPVPSISH